MNAALQVSESMAIVVTSKARGFRQHLRANCLYGTCFADKAVQIVWKEGPNQRGTAGMVEGKSANKATHGGLLQSDHYFLNRGQDHRYFRGRWCEPGFSSFRTTSTPSGVGHMPLLIVRSVPTYNTRYVASSVGTKVP